ncbi:hypothetical protein F5X71_24965 [Nocardia brasiliensis]|uniref:DUF4439 domain-containing protein n=1 Tax=Nocardia brasiliensis TaxID=37326 RepID=A0A6G9Y3L8_NOCBR|nr:hypothetical protein F5X71_24965 [Nocardia brasiliensis]
MQPSAARSSGCPPDRHDSRFPMDRRTALRLAGGGAVGVLALGAAVGCATEDTVHEPDPLAAQEVKARTDAAAATAAIALAPHKHAALTAIATERTAHADALRAEIARVIGVYGDGTTPAHRTRASAPGPAAGSAAVASGTAVPPVAAPSLDTLRAQLTESRQSAAALASSQSGYRAGLLASISAACAAEAGVLLA